jgi:histidyl-tRNA synthetase
MSKTQPARGMRDFLPADVRKRNYVIGIIKEVYESYGFEPLETPAVENLETLTGKYGEEGNQLMFRILKRGEKLDVSNGEKGLADLALRYDLTVPLARVVANYKNDLPRFFKRYQIQPVWRADRPARGRYREFYQCDVDAIGSGSMIVEAELISAVSEILQRLGFGDFVIKLNHRELLRAMLMMAEIAKEKHADALTAIDKLDKIQREGVFRELSERGITDNSANKILDLFDRINLRWSQPGGTNRSILSELYDFTSGAEALNDLDKILEFSSGSHIKIDPSLARGLSYYTGAIFEIDVGKEIGSLGGGGRYDGLIGMFGKEQIPACGFSLGLERILVVMDERGMFDKPIEEGKLKLDSADVMIACFDEQLIGECLKLASELRQTELRVLVYPEASQKGKPVKYAEQIDVPFVCLLKENELAENNVTLKNMQTGEQETVSREEISGKIKS